MIQSRRLEYEQLPDRLVQDVPELAAPYEEYLRWLNGGQPLPHIVFGDLLNPYLISLLSANGDSTRLGPVFRLLEELSAHEDHRVRGVAAFTVFERLIGEGLLGRAWRYMGDASRGLAFDLLTVHYRSDETEPVDEERYQRRWREEIAKQGGMEDISADAIHSIRERIYAEFGIKRYPRSQAGPSTA